ncbi:PfkB family carbohydrate kinase [Lentilactobacillus hilgardii]|uniref:PfkB family carbohydrate kinase n=1 Tax=Lentilactobacillus hilgardii TaxID=1588 RepID=UPI0021A477A1|nr:PfkB family carbohydrate kinase [Lentilactobacillus hilgardii]MCT3391433.1 fructoselysine 6-kinase [Lentilactobacillus hilgardii]
MKVIGVGDNVVDMYIDKGKMFLGGNALNFAVFASKLNYSAAFLGVFGDDKLADYAKSTLQHFKIDLGHSKTKHGENGYSRVTVENGDRTFIDSNQGGVLQKGLDLSSKDIDYINNFSVAHFNINGAADSYLPKIKGPKIIYDFSDLYTYPKIKEVAHWINVGCFSVGNMTRQNVIRLCKRVAGTGIKLVLCTMGSNGAVVYAAGKFFWQPAIPTQVVDTMGAGDSFITAFGTNLFNDKFGEINDFRIKASLREAADFAAQQVKVPGSFDYGENLIF